MTASGRTEVTKALRYRDSGSGCQVVVTTPGATTELWEQYVAGAVNSYRAHGVEHALDYAQMQDGRSSSLLFAALDERGTVVGGIRSQGPYESVEQTHAIMEWAGEDGEAELRDALARRVPEGLVELKAAWVADDHPRRRQLVACLSRTPIHAASVLEARYAFGTAAAHAVPGWVAAGGVVADEVPAVAYPDERYRTRLVTWDRQDLLRRLSGEERDAVLSEAAQLRAPTVPSQPTRGEASGAVALAVGGRGGVAARQGEPPRDRPNE